MGRWRRRTHEQSGGETAAGTAVDADDHLVDRARHDPVAFAALYDRYFPAVYGYCLAELRDPEAAADATAHAFLKAMAALGGYREGGRFRAWLFTIAHNVVIDALPRRRPDEPLEAAATVPDPAPSPEEAALATLDLERLEAAIGRLPVADQRVLELRRAGLSGREIAATLGIAHEAAKMRQRRAVDRLKHDLLAAPAGSEVRREA